MLEMMLDLVSTLSICIFVCVLHKYKHVNALPINFHVMCNDFCWGLNALLWFNFLMLSIQILKEKTTMKIDCHCYLVSISQWCMNSNVEVCILFLIQEHVQIMGAEAFCLRNSLELSYDWFGLTHPSMLYYVCMRNCTPESFYFCWSRKTILWPLTL
jgi:hypothetical protein